MVGVLSQAHHFVQQARRTVERGQTPQLLMIVVSAESGDLQATQASDFAHFFNLVDAVLAAARVDIEVLAEVNRPDSPTV